MAFRDNGRAPRALNRASVWLIRDDRQTQTPGGEARKGLLAERGRPSPRDARPAQIDPKQPSGYPGSSRSRDAEQRQEQSWLSFLTSYSFLSWLKEPQI
ncbi:hypothetical protein BCEN4_350062 [Burkholderia cenocepacia]|nr:hypothetical protein BCEN4_350062 [Burkholderia cenocepacia]